METEPKKPRSAIDQAIDTCHDIIRTQRIENFRILILALVVVIGCIIYFVMSFMYSYREPGSNVNGTQGYLIYIFGIVMLSILTAFYRFHLKEISRAQQNLIAFMRIRIAGSNFENGFASEVRKALTEHVFYSEPIETRAVKGKKVESPVPGHPAVELSTLVINKFFEFIAEKEKKTSSSGGTQ